jgi:hypothetical protein
MRFSLIQRNVRDMRTGPVVADSDHTNAETDKRQMSQRTLALSTIKSDLDAGIPDKELIEKYEISPDGLQVLFDKLIQAMANGSSHIRLESE